MPSISLVYIFQEMRRFYHKKTESIFGAPYKNNPTISQEHEPSLLKCAIPR